MELENLNNDWQALQNAFNKLREQMGELSRQQNELWQKQNDLCIAGMNAGYKLDMKTKEWKKPEKVAKKIRSCDCGNDQPYQFSGFEIKWGDYYYEIDTCLLCGESTCKRRKYEK